MIEFVAFAEELRRIVPITYFSDPSSSTQQLSACLIFKGRLKNVLKELPSSIHDLNSTDNHQYAKVIKPDVLQYLTEHLIEQTIQVMLIENENNLEFPYQLVQKDQSDFQAIVKHIKKQYDIKLISSQKQDPLSVLLGKYDKNIDCETIDKFKSVFISCHAFLILEIDEQIQIYNQKVKWIELKHLMNYDCLRTVKTDDSQTIRETLRHSSFVSDAAKRKARNVEFACLLINDKKLKGIFLQLWLYAVEVMIAGSHSKYHKNILSDYIHKAQQFDINFRWYHPFGFLMKRNAKKNYQRQMDKFSYLQRESAPIYPYVIGGGILIALVVGGVFGYKKWKTKQ